MLISLLVLVGACVLGALPLTGWLFRALTGKDLAQLGTGNVSVSAAFIHGGKLAGIACALLEAARGIAVVLVARAATPAPDWPLLSLAALVAGRFWFGRAAGATNAWWGLLVYAPTVTAVLTLSGLVPWLLLRGRSGRRWGQLVALTAMPFAFYWQSGQSAVAAAAAFLALWLGYALLRLPDDADLARRSRPLSLAEPLLPAIAGNKAASLARLRRAGLVVPAGWVLLPGQDPGLIPGKPTPEQPWIARSSATGEDSRESAAAGQYLSVGGITDALQLREALTRVRASYDSEAARQYRASRGQSTGSMAVLVQPEIRGLWSGVAFTRDPLSGAGVVVIEALPGGAAAVVGGRSTPERASLERQSGQPVEAGAIPAEVLQAVYTAAMAVEQVFDNLPQDIEWTWDGEKLWLLQARPVTSLIPVWTRTIAAEVIPGVIRPLTWSINRPLTCGVWGEIFTIVLGERAAGIDFEETATLLDGWAYFNATLLGDLFRRMGLPPESLDFLYRGSRFSRPPLASVVANLPGLVRLGLRDWQLDRDFCRLDAELLGPLVASLETEALAGLSPRQLLGRAERIAVGLRLVTYYQILAPLGLALRRAVLRVDEDWLGEAATAEVRAVRELGELAAEARAAGPAAVRSHLDAFLARYGYLSEVGTDIAVPTWREHPEAVNALFEAMSQIPRPLAARSAPQGISQQLRARICLTRARTRARVAEVYDRLLAHLRWTFVALEAHWRSAGVLAAEGDIFFLSEAEVGALVRAELAGAEAQAQIAARRADYERQRKLTVPRVVYGNRIPEQVQPQPVDGRLKGIAASSGRAEGTVRVLTGVSGELRLAPDTILVVPYTDAGWAPLLAQARAIVSEVGGRLSHGAIVAREYGLPAVMNVAGATSLLRDGQRVRVNGSAGTVEILSESSA